ncbi:MAG: hypothetical protein JWP63_7221, partial [Candidatus Solibacter sp.]|nr:hypothetical protein [Candidatus Solibacter sp.]
MSLRVTRLGPSNSTILRPLLGLIHLGEDVPAALNPLYRGELLV